MIASDVPSTPVPLVLAARRVVGPPCAQVSLTFRPPRCRRPFQCPGPPSSRLDAREVEKERKKKLKGGNATRGLPRRSPILIKRGECNTRTSQEVTHPSTTLAQARLTSEF